MQTFEEKNNRLQPTVSAIHMSINRRAKNNRKRTNINHSVYRTARTLNSMRPDGYEYRQVIPSRPVRAGRNGGPHKIPGYALAR